MIGYQPSPWQQRFHECPVYEVLGAGAAGPGKTAALTADPLRQAQIEAARVKRDPRVAGVTDESSDMFTLLRDNPLRKGDSSAWYLILRRSMKSLAQVEANALKLYMAFDRNVKHHVNSHTFTLSSGMRVQFGHCQNPDDWEQYLGSEYTSIGYDELILFEEEQFKQINSRCRTTDPVLQFFRHIKCTSNPVMKRAKDEQFSVSDPQWVKRRYYDPCPEGGEVLVERREAPDGRTVEYERIFLPATLYDNPNKDFVRQYESDLLFQKAHIRDALLYGRWDIVVGGYWTDDFDPRTHVLKPFRINRGWRFFRSMDWGFREPGCVHWWALAPDGVLFVFREYTFRGLRAGDVALKIREQEKQMGLWDNKTNSSKISGVSDNQLWEERGDEGTNKAAEMAKYGVTWKKADKSPGSRRRNGQIISSRFRNPLKPDEKPTLFVFDTCVKLREKIPLVQTSQTDHEAPADQPDMHWVDSFMYGAHYAERGFSAIAPLNDVPDRRDYDSDDNESAYGA